MFKIIIIIAITLFIISALMIHVIPRNKLTNGTDMPKVARIGCVIFLLSVFIFIIGVIGLLPINDILIN